MKKSLLLATLLSITLSACTSNSDDSTNNNSNSDTSTPDAPQSTGAPNLNRSDFMTGLNTPWDLAFLPDGTMFFTEKCKGLSVRHRNGSVTQLFGGAGSTLVAPDFFCLGQSGMNGVAVDPNFANNRLVYVYMASNRTTPHFNHVVRLQVNADFTSVSNRVDIVTDIPFKNAANNWGGAGLHSGGRIRFGPDGFLYITTGDNHNGTLPQDLTRLGGKVLRVDRDGVAAIGNNTPRSGDPRIYTYGHRNVQGISFRPGTGQPFISEHGPSHDDEVTALRPGGNGGWDPKPEPGVSCADNYCGYISNKLDGTPTPMTDTVKFPDAMRPTWARKVSAGMGPCTFLSGPQWKGWDGALAVGVMAAGELDILQINSDASLRSLTKAPLSGVRFRSLVQGPDGNLYISIDQGSIWKVVPQ